MERNSSKDLTVQRQALADVCKIDVLKDFAKFTGKHLYQILYLMKLVYLNRARRRCFPVNFVEFLRTPVLWNSSRRQFLTLQVHKIAKNVSRYRNKDIKVISIEEIIVSLSQL